MPGSPVLRRSAAVVAAALAALLAPALVATPAFAAEDADDAIPERIVLTPAADASTAQAFTWRTGASVLGGEVRIREVGAAEWRAVAAYANDELLTGGVLTRTHSATVDGLEPATEYEYTVGDDVERSETYRFTTAGEAGDPFTFIYFGDAQNDIEERWTPVVAQAYERFPDAVGTVNAGDLINTASNDSEWTEWFGAMDGYSQTTNVIAAPGNHEYSGDAFLRNWKSNFEYPATGPQHDGSTGESAGERQEAAYRAHMAEVITETAYYVDYQGVRFISLNASRSQAAELFTPDDLPFCLIGCPNPTELWLDMQAEWLDEILADNPNKWSVAVFHQPVFSTAEGRDEVDVRAAWLPVFQRNDIDLVLMGHDHTYARGYVNADATETPGLTTGPVYAVAVSGPKYYEQQPEGNNVWTRNGATQVVRAGHTSTFQGITVTEDQIRYESIVGAKWDGEEESTTDVPVGGVLDSFTITKYDDGTKWVTEDGVEIPAEGVPGPGTGEPEEPDVPGEEPDDVPLGHRVVGGLELPGIAEPGPVAFDRASGTLFATDRAADGEGLVAAINPETGEVLDGFEVGAPVRDISYEPALGAVIVLFGDSVIGAYSTASSSFGTPIVDEIPAGLLTGGQEVVSAVVDAGTGVLHIGLASGVVIPFDVEDEEAGTPALLGAGLERMRVDSATGNVYATFAGEEGEVGLRVLAGRSGYAPLGEFELAAGAASVDLDTARGLAYVGHRAGGLSVVDLLGESVTRLGAAEFGSDIEGVAVDGGLGLVYAASSTATPDPVVVVGREQAPRILEGPRAVAADEGETVSFTARAHGVPAPSVSWQELLPGGEWTTIAGAEETTLELVAETDGALYRAVFANEIGGEERTTATASARLTVREDDEEPGGPGEEEPSGPGEKPTGTPAPIDDELLTSATRGGVTATVAGSTVTIRTGAGNAEQWTGVYVHSTPRFLGWIASSATGELSATLPAGLSGEHRVVVLDADGELIGWAPITLAADGEIALTGSTLPVAAIVVAVLLLALGAGVVVWRRRRPAATRD